VKGTRPQKLPAASREEPEGRVCAANGCDTLLSVYNSRDVCWQHSDLTFPNYRGKRLSDPERA
jgi:hypothetical protein